MAPRQAGKHDQLVSELFDKWQSNPEAGLLGMSGYGKYDFYADTMHVPVSTISQITGINPEVVKDRRRYLRQLEGGERRRRERRERAEEMNRHFDPEFYRDLDEGVARLEALGGRHNSPYDNVMDGNWADHDARPELAEGDPEYREDKHRYVVWGEGKGKPAGDHRVENFRGPISPGSDAGVARNPYTGDTETGRFNGNPEGRGHWDKDDRTDFRPPKTSRRRRAGATGTVSGDTYKSNERRKESAMSLAARGRVASKGRRQHFADESRNDQGVQEPAFITQTPAAEAVEAPTGDESKITNTESNLVARVQRGTAQLQRDAAALAKLRRMQRDDQRRTGRRRMAAGNCADCGMPMEDYTEFPGPDGPRCMRCYEKDPEVQYMTRNMDADTLSRMWGGGPKRKRGSERRAEATESADKVDPSLSGTNDQSLKGDLEALQPEQVATQPKDASLKVFKAFDGWLRQTAGRSARELHPKALTRQAARFCKATGTSPRAMYPAMGYALREARKVEANTRGAAVNRRRVAVDLPAAAPDARVDVEAPVKNTTDDAAQASQPVLSDYGQNAGDSVANPDLSTDSQIWAPGEKTSRKADGVMAVRCAEAYIKAGLEPEESRWRLAALFQTMNRGFVQRDIALLERVAAMRAEDAARTARRTPGSSRGATKGFPPGLGGAPRRTAGVERVASNDPVNDAALWI